MQTRKEKKRKVIFKIDKNDNSQKEGKEKVRYIIYRTE